MTKEISLQKLIDQVNSELLMPTRSPAYPMFFVDKVELELAVNISQEASGDIGISVLEVASGKVAAKSTHQNLHTIKLVLTPILSAEERRALLDERTMKGIQKASIATVRGTDDLEALADS